MTKKTVLIKVDDKTTIEVESNVLDQNIHDQPSFPTTAKHIEEFDLLKDKFENLQKFVSLVNDTIVKSAKGVSEVDIEFGVKFGGKTGLIISEVSVDSSLKVSVKWRT